MPIRVERAGGALGARITGVDLAQPLDNERFAAIHDAFVTHMVVVFPDQEITPEQHVAFSRRFGPLEQHVLKGNLLEGLPEIYVLSNIVEEGKPKGRAYAGSYWHSDLTYQARPSLGSIMHALEIPALGGDTMFCNMALAYDTLSDKMRAMVEGLRAVHSLEHAYRMMVQRQKNYVPIKPEELAARPPVEHPVVRTHPVTGRKCLFVNPGFTDHIAGLSRDESDGILDILYRHATRPEFVYRHRWSRHDVVMWDNRATMHHAVADYGPQDRRLMHRTTITGDLPN